MVSVGPTAVVSLGRWVFTGASGYGVRRKPGILARKTTVGSSSSRFLVGSLPAFVKNPEPPY